MQKCDFNTVEVRLLYDCSPVNWLNIRKTPFFKNYLWATAFVYVEKITIDTSPYPPVQS